MDIIGKITGIKYQVIFTENLKDVKIKGFDINEMPSSCLLTSNKNTFAITKFFSENSFSHLQIKLVEIIFSEAKQNNFIIQIQHSK